MTRNKTLKYDGPLRACPKSSNELTRGLGTGKHPRRWGRGWETEENETSRDGAGNGRRTGEGGAQDASGRQERRREGEDLAFQTRSL